MVAKQRASEAKRDIAGRGRTMVDGLKRGADIAHDTAMMTALHVRRLASIATSTVAQVETEIRELVLDVRDVAVTGLRREPEDVALPPDTGHVRLPTAKCASSKH